MSLPSFSVRNPVLVQRGRRPVERQVGIGEVEGRAHRGHAVQFHPCAAMGKLRIVDFATRAVGGHSQETGRRQ